MKRQNLRRDERYMTTVVDNILLFIAITGNELLLELNNSSVPRNSVSQSRVKNVLKIIVFYNSKL